MRREFARALKKEKQYLTPIQRAVFIAVGLGLIAAEVVLITGAVRSRRYGLLALAVPMLVLVGFGNAMLTAAIKSSPEYRQHN